MTAQFTHGNPRRTEYIPKFPIVARALRQFHGDVVAWWQDFQTRPAFSRESDEDVLVMLGLSACFSSTSDGEPQLPFDTRTARLRDDVWGQWLKWDPVRMVPLHADALLSLRAIWIDAGTRDDWYLDLGAVALHDELRRIGVSDIRFELFDATHLDIDYRYPLSLKYLAEKLQ